MIIRAQIEGRTGIPRTKYYVHTSNGKPIYGARGDAAKFDRETGEKVLAQLKQIDHRCAQTAELVNE